MRKLTVAYAMGLHWGTFGKDGKNPLEVRTLGDLENA